MLGYLLSPVLQIEDINGIPLTGGKIYVYRANTSDLATVYSNYEGTLSTNPVILDELGHATIIADDETLYDITVKDSSNNLIMSVEDVAVGGEGGSAIVSDVVVRAGNNGITVTQSVENQTKVFKVFIDYNFVASQSDLATKQNILTPGANIDITNDVISVTGMTSNLSAGVNIDATKLANNYIDLNNNNCSAYSTNIAVGDRTKAYGSYTFAQGMQVEANDYVTHAEGGGTTASGQFSHSEGYGSVTKGFGSHAEGGETSALGIYSHAEGAGSYVFPTSTACHAEGIECYASGNAGHAEGSGTSALANYSHSEGRETKSNGQYSHTEGAFTLANNTYSHAEGSATSAIGSYSHAEGNSAYSNAQGSHAEGYGTSAVGFASHAEGYRTRAHGQESHAEGSNTSAIGSNSHAEGVFTIASSYRCHAEGSMTSAMGDASHAEGAATQAIGSESHAEGRWSIAQGDQSHAEGESCKTIAFAAHAEGFYTSATNTASHSEGYQTSAAGEYAHAEGRETSALGKYSHSEGLWTVANGEGSIAAGNGVSAIGWGQVVLGSYNLPNASHILQIGCGVGDIGDQRKNAIEVRGDASVWYRYNNTMYNMRPYSAGDGITINDYVIASHPSVPKHGGWVYAGDTGSVNYTAMAGDTFQIQFEKENGNALGNIKVYNSTNDRFMYGIINYTGTPVSVSELQTATVLSGITDYGIARLDIVGMGVGNEIPRCSFTITYNVTNGGLYYTIYDEYLY